MKDAFAYLLVTSLIAFVALLVPMLVLGFYAGSMLTALFTILIVPLLILMIFIASGIFHLAVIATSGKRKRFIDTFKLMVFVSQTKLLVGLALIFAFGALVLALFGSIPYQAFTILGALALSGFTATFAVLYVAFLIVLQLYGAYFSFMTLVGLSKVHHISLEKSFWTIVLGAVFGIIVSLPLYAWLFLSYF